MLDEVYDSIDDGLENHKMLIIQKARENSEVVHKTGFDESNYAIREISKDVAIHMRDIYRDTMLYMQSEEDFEPVRVLTSAFEINNRFYELKIIASMVEEDDLIEDLFFSLIWLYIILVIVILLVNNILLKRVWKPFYTILHQLKTYRLGKDQIPHQITSSVSEFRELNEAVIALLHRNLETFTNQKQFTENAAHELQTPLAIGINKLEFLLEKNDLNETQSEALGQIVQILERLTRLNKSLLLLSKIDNKQFFENEEVFVNGITKSLIESFGDLAEFKRVTINYTENGSLK
jgi:signal transduction histidine kinase